MTRRWKPGSKTETGGLVYRRVYGGRGKKYRTVYASGMKIRDKGLYSKRARETKIEKGWNRAMKTKVWNDTGFGEMAVNNNAVCRSKNNAEKSIDKIS